VWEQDVKRNVQAELGTRKQQGIGGIHENRFGECDDPF
jgi:hypothetical protein